ncbi:MAG: helix-turn-helix transcriptional regulator [Bacteroidales bacterium]|nr:helix-turn-helix transcriptional regulator [Bacteroidales bacterium]
MLKNAVNTISCVNEEPESTDNYELSERETDVLVLVARGLSSKAIADKLNISIHTVNSHRKNITHKTGIKSVAGLAVYAMIHNLME